ncbi:MAG: SMC family ATPase, partial [Gemmatimonadota bacterium]
MSEHFVFREIDLRRTPGFPRGGPALDGLSPGINIVFGPQQAGKTSTMDALQWLLWPRTAAPHASVYARLGIDGEEWIAQMDGGRTRWQRAGSESAPPPLPPAEQRDRYRLALQDLLLGDNESFAQAIARESAGGYDLSELARTVGVRTKATSSNALKQDLEAARARLKEAQAEEQAVREEEERLPELEV